MIAFLRRKGGGGTKKRLVVAGAVLGALALLAAGAATLFYNGVIWFNTPSGRDYPVRGVDVSRYQGDIDWPALAAQDLSFAFIKATEGSGHTDPMFAANWQAALATPLRVGAYHFFSYDSPAAAQADHFIATVPAAAGMLPPAIDLEFYGDKEKNPPDAGTVRAELDVMLRRLQAHYGLRPVIYATAKSYRLYLAGHFEEYDIWIRELFLRPRLPDGRDWTFWQYTNRGRLQGYAGPERFIDINVFAGSAAEFAAYGAPGS